MRSVEDHLQRVLSNVTALSPLDVSLLDGLGCVLAEDVTAPWPLPPFDNSAMDGYAVRAEDVAPATREHPVTLRVLDDVPAGHRATQPLRPGAAIRIMTGAPVPEGTEAVVPVEQTDAGMPQVKVHEPIARGRHIRRRGEDIAIGQQVLSAGAVLGPRELALLAGVGRARVSVHPKPRVVVLSTGSELVDPGTALAPGLIPDSNGVTLAAAAMQAGAIAYRVGPVADDGEVLVRTLEDQLVRADLVITTGGVSAGAYDIVKSVLGRIGTVEFTKVAMAPGKPQGHGHLGPDQTPIFTLPGNPVSAYVSFEVFVRPVIRRLLGHDQVHRPVVRATCTSAITSPAGKRQFLRGQLSVVDGAYVVRPVTGQGSHMLGGLVQANALLVVPEDRTAVAAGDPVAVLRLDGEAGEL